MLSLFSKKNIRLLIIQHFSSKVQMELMAFRTVITLRMYLMLEMRVAAAPTIHVMQSRIGV